MSGQKPKKTRKLSFAPFFLGAAVVGAVEVPMWAGQYLGIGGPWADFPPPYWHGHEMIFGYTLAVLGGYLLTKAHGRVLGLLFCVWVAGRIGFMIGDALPAVLQAVIALLYPAGLFFYAGIPFIRSAKRWRTNVPGLLLGGFFFAELTFQLGVLDILVGGEWIGLALGLDLIALLLFLMGGRVIAAATSGAIQAKGDYLKGVAQQKTELAGLVFLIAMTFCDAFGLASEISGVLAALSAAVIAVRLVRWKVWLVIDALDITSLHVGYAFLAIGLGLKSIDGLTGGFGYFEAVHGIGIGGLGILSLTIMGRAVVQRTGLSRELPVSIRIALALMIVAALLRLMVFLVESPDWILMAAAMAWTLAMVMFAFIVISSLIRSAK